MMKHANHKINVETLEAMKEAERGTLRNVPEIDTSSVEAMVKSKEFSSKSTKNKIGYNRKRL